MIFYLGCKPHQAQHTPHAMISANILRDRRSMFNANHWIMDSGAFTLVNKHGGYPHTVHDYAHTIRRFSQCGDLQAAVAQDYMCEPHVLARTGHTVLRHQQLTIERYDQLIACDTNNIAIMPVLQGWDPHHYPAHINLYGDRLTTGMWVGVGSVCKRNAKPDTIRHIINCIQAERPDLKLHGFGIKLNALQDPDLRTRFHTADSFAWSYTARVTGGDGNSTTEALAYAARVNEA